jgi:hypothetical protein
MANSDKNIKITPNISQTAQPNVVFTGQGAVPITLKVLDDSFGTLSFEGSAGQLFSVNNNLSTGVIFSVNDISGIPQIDVNADGTIRLAPFGTTLNVGGISGSAFTIQPSTRASTGAGANVTIAAGSGVTTGAGGSVILQPGAQATSGGNGVVIVRQPGGTAGTDEGQVYHDGTDLYVVNKEGGSASNSVRLQTNAGYGVYASNRSTGAFSCLDATSGTLLIAYQASVSLSYWSVSGSTGAFTTFNDAYRLNWPGSGLLSNAGAILSITGGSTSGTSTGGSLAFTSSSPSGYAANQDNLVLTGSAFQRLSGTAARDITGVAPPSGGSHVDGRMMRIYNVGSFNLTLKHNSLSSTAANRFYCIGAADIVIAAGDYAELIYDSTNNGSAAAGWRVY